MSDFTMTLLAIIEYQINECGSKQKYYSERLKELIAIRDKIREELIKEYEPLNNDILEDLQ